MCAVFWVQLFFLFKTQHALRMAFLEFFIELEKQLKKQAMFLCEEGLISILFLLQSACQECWNYNAVELANLSSHSFSAIWFLPYLGFLGFLIKNTIIIWH